MYMYVLSLSLYIYIYIHIGAFGLFEAEASHESGIRDSDSEHLNL